MTRRPKVFIGCSVPGIEVAEALQLLLEYSANCQIWNQGIMELSTSTLDNLVNALGRFEFGIFVLTPDDKTEQRDQFGMTPRDNVIFELGLFIGRLGPKKTFMVRPRGVDLRIPTDLWGIEPADYDSADKELESALGSAATRIKRAIVKAQADSVSQ